MKKLEHLNVAKCFVRHNYGMNGRYISAFKAQCGLNLNDYQPQVGTC